MIHRTILLCTFATLVVHSCCAQGDPSERSGQDYQYSDLDTITFYAVSIEYRRSRWPFRYSVDSWPASKKTYSKYNKAYVALAACRPCYVRTYNRNGVLIREGEQYTDCSVGTWVEYHPNGKKRVEGLFRRNQTADWTDIWNRGLCNTKEGVWTYYDVNGIVLERKEYVNGVLVATRKPTDP